MSLRIGEWQPVPAGDGDAVALGGARLAVASSARLEVVDRHATLAAVDAPWPAPGVPRFHGDRVLWGPGVLDLATRSYRPVMAAAPATWPGGGERPSVYAWAADGTRLLACFGERNVLLSAVGEPLATVATASGLAPAAAWVGRDRALVDLGPFGRELLPIVSFSADAAEHHLLAVALNQAVVRVDLLAGAVVDEWPGPWAGVAVAPGGDHAAVLASAGTVTIASLAGGRFEPRAEIAPPAGSGPPRAVAYDGLAVAVCGGGAVALATVGADRGVSS